MKRTTTCPKIVLFGSESTGKTTLAQALAEHYGTVWVPEYARQYLENEQIVCRPTDIVPIAQGQIRLEEEAMALASRLLVCDTNILQTKVYSEAYFGWCPEWLLNEVKHRVYDFYLLTDIDVPWTPDPLRDRPDHRPEMHQRFRKELQERNVPFAPLSGTEQHRMERAIEWVDGFLAKNTLNK